MWLITIERLTMAILTLTVRTEAFPIPAFSRYFSKKKAVVHRHGRSGSLRW